MFENLGGFSKSILSLFLLALLPIAIPYFAVFLPVLWNLFSTAIVHILNHRSDTFRRNHRQDQSPPHLESVADSNVLLSDDIPSINGLGFDYSPEDDDTIEEDLSEASDDDTEHDYSPHFHSPLSFEERKRQKKLQNREILDLFNLQYVTDDEEDDDDDEADREDNPFIKNDYFDFHKRSLFDGSGSHLSSGPLLSDRSPLYNEDYGSDDSSEEENQTNEAMVEIEADDEDGENINRISSNILEDNRRILSLVELNQRWSDHYSQ